MGGPEIKRETLSTSNFKQHTITIFKNTLSIMVSPRTLSVIIKKQVLASIDGKIKNIIHRTPQS